MKLADIKLRDLLPIFMRRDDFDVALADALSAPLVTFARECRKLSTFDALEELSEEELDALAEELQVLWYDVTLPIEKKRALIAQSDLVYMRLGTKAAVQQIVEAVFGESTVEEFFDYGGRPHYFRIRVADVGSLTAEAEAKLLRLLDYVKRRSQWLEAIVSEVLTEYPLNAGIHCTIQKVDTLLVDEFQNNLTTPGARAGGSAEITNAETTTAKP